MVEATMADRAEKLSRRRARLMPVLAVFYLAQQYSYFSAGGARVVDHVRIGAWAVMSFALLAALMSGGGLLRGAAIRAILNDEVTRVHRADALGCGFVVAMLTGIVLYVMGNALIDERQAIHLIVSLGIATALIRFGMLERRSHRDG